MKDAFWHFILLLLKATLLRTPKEFSSIADLHIQIAVLKAAQSPVSYSFSFAVKASGFHPIYKSF